MNTLMLTESNYPIDIRIKQEAELLNNNGHNVSVIAIRDKGQCFYEQINGVKVYRVPKIELFAKVDKNGYKAVPFKFIRKIFSFMKALIGYSFEYAYFTTACLFLSTIIIPVDKINVIHTHNPPDTLFVIALFYKIFFRIKFVYDHHDLSPNLFQEKYSKNGNIIYRMLCLLERISCKTADYVIATNESYKEVEIERCGVRPEKIFIVRNGPDLNRMKRMEPVEGIKRKGSTILCYIGAINIQDGVQHLIVVLAKIVYKYNFSNIRLLIIGNGDYLSEVKMLARELMVEDYIIFTGMVKNRIEVYRYLSSADIFVDAAPSSFLNERSTFIKHMEYMAFGRPVVSFDLKESIYSLQDAGLFIPSNDSDKMAESIISLISDKERRQRMSRHALERAKQLSWQNVSIPLIKLYSLLNRS